MFLTGHGPFYFKAKRWIPMHLFCLRPSRCPIAMLSPLFNIIPFSHSESTLLFPLYLTFFAWLYSLFYPQFSWLLPCLRSSFMSQFPEKAFPSHPFKVFQISAPPQSSPCFILLISLIIVLFWISLFTFLSTRLYVAQEHKPLLFNYEFLVCL